MAIFGRKGASDGTASSTLLNPNPYAKRSYNNNRMTGPASKRNFMILTVGLLLVNLVLLALGGVVVAFMGYTTRWILIAPHIGRGYILKQDALVPDTPPAYRNIMIYPASYQLIGTRMVLAAGGATFIMAVGTVLFVILYGLRAQKRANNQSVRPINRFSVLLIGSVVTLLFTLVTLLVSWPEYYRNSPLYFSTNTIVWGVYDYNVNKLTPEYWLEHLSASIEGADKQAFLHGKYIWAFIPRILVLPIVVLQIIGLTALFMLRERMKPGASPFTSGGYEVLEKSRNMEQDHGNSSHLEPMRGMRPMHADHGSEVDVSEGTELVEKSMEVPKASHEWPNTPSIRIDDPNSYNSMPNTPHMGAYASAPSTPGLPHQQGGHQGYAQTHGEA